MADRTASNYNGKTGKTNVVMQGQTSGAYGSDPALQRREGHPPKETKP